MALTKIRQEQGVVINEGSTDVDFRVESNGQTHKLFVNGGEDVVCFGFETPETVGGIESGVQIEGTDYAGGSLSIWRNANDDAGGYLQLGKSRGTAVNSDTIVQDNDDVGIINFIGADGTDRAHPIASIRAAVDGTPGNNDMPGRIEFMTTADGGTTLTERMRIDSSGNLLVGTTDDTLYNNTSGSGIMLAASGRIDVARVQDVCAILNRTGASDGSIINFAKNGTTLGNISCIGGERISIHTGTVGIEFNPSNQVNPSSGSAGLDNTLDLGASGTRWDDIYATNGTIQTSDFNEKQDIAALTSTEMLVGKRISALFKTFRWKDKVASKGDNARTHTGIIAQDVQAAFTAEGLDAGDYSLFISSTWLVDSEGNVVEEGTEGAVSKTRMGIRYPELLSFVAAYNEQRFANIEARITALE